MLGARQRREQEGDPIRSPDEPSSRGSGSRSAPPHLTDSANHSTMPDAGPLQRIHLPSHGCGELWGIDQGTYWALRRSSCCAGSGLLDLNPFHG